MRTQTGMMLFRTRMMIQKTKRRILLHPKKMKRMRENTLEKVKRTRRILLLKMKRVRRMGRNTLKKVRRILLLKMKRVRRMEKVIAAMSKMDVGNNAITRR